VAKDLRSEFATLSGVGNNASLGTGGMLTKMPVRTIQRMTRPNVVSPMNLTKFAALSMMTARGARIV